MLDYEFTLGGSTFHAAPTGALWWPAQRILVVSDLHLGKTERLMRIGGPSLPPYEIRDTLMRLEHDVDRFDPDHIIRLGDSFYDITSVQSLTPDDLSFLTRLQSGRQWTWITGNHDVGQFGLDGQNHESLSRENIDFRHIADTTQTNCEISGHYHPKASITVKRQRLTRSCFLLDERRLILPAYGTYTGGLDCARQPLCDIMSTGAIAILTGKTARAIPMPRR